MPRHHKAFDAPNGVGHATVAGGYVTRPRFERLMKTAWSGPLIISIVMLSAIALVDFASAYTFATLGQFASGAIWTARAVALVLLFAAALLNQKTPHSIKRPLIAYLILVIIYVIVGLAIGGKFQIVAGSAQTLCLPIILIVVGYSLVRRASDLIVQSYIVLALCVATTIFGVWDRENTEFWLTTMQFGHYLNEVKGIVRGFNPVTFLPWNFTGYLNTRRAAGLLAAPLAQGMYLSFGCVLALAISRQRRLIVGGALAALLGMGIYQSGTRGAMVAALCGLALYLSANNKTKSQLAQNAVLFVMAVFAAFQIIAPVFLYTVNLVDDSSIGHLQALTANISGLSNVLLFGAGIGTGGAYAANAGVDTLGGGEGAIFTVIYQTGIPGGLIFLWLYYTIIRRLWRARRLRESTVRDLALATWAFAIGFANTFISSEHAFSLSGGGTVWFIAGAALRAVELEQRLEIKSQSRINIASSITNNFRPGSPSRKSPLLGKARMRLT